MKAGPRGGGCYLASFTAIALATHTERVGGIIVLFILGPWGAVIPGGVDICRDLSTYNSRGVAIRLSSARDGPEFDASGRRLGMVDRQPHRHLLRIRAYASASTKDSVILLALPNGIFVS